MNYYKIILPINLNKSFTYKTKEYLEIGCRVHIPFANTFHTGIVWEEDPAPSKDIKYKEITEIIDKFSLLPLELLYLAEWMSRYYFCSLGQTLAAMLPSAFNVKLLLRIKRTDKTDEITDSNATAILQKIPFENWIKIDELKKEVKKKKFRFWLDKLEEEKYIETERTYDAKIKKKIANFIKLKFPENLPKLTDRQEEIYNELQNIGNYFLLSKVAKTYSYSHIKNLRKAGLLEIEAKEVFSDFEQFPKKGNPKKISLSAEQISVISKIGSGVDTKSFKAFLLFGITGSGKTEVYIHSIRNCISQNKTALMLVPEISLTPQLTQRFYGEFQENIAVLHSHLNDRERWEQWKKIKNKECRIVIGARSAIFAPLTNIGLIIVDEEHETSFKQDKTPRYNGRDLAIVRAKKSNAVVILGTATPSLESWSNTLSCKYSLLTLKNRPFKVTLPKVQIIDMKTEAKPKELLSEKLKKAIELRLQKEEQIILFQNRRGHSSFIQCVSCGLLIKCPKCEISMNYHSRGSEMLCHYCGHKINLPRSCPDCGSFMFAYGAPGTQQVEKQLQLLFPTARILRMDSDSARKKDSYESMFKRMQNGHIDILLGTQMIAKGLDFPEVTLVGVISADISLNVPDFRAAERTFQLLTQVSGRSGRGKKSGEVIIQTYNPEHYSITQSVKADFEKFAETELNLRNVLNYPPFYKLGRFVFSHKTEGFIKEQLSKNTRVISDLQKIFTAKEILLLGPSPAPLPKIKNSFRYHLIIKANSVENLSKAVKFLEGNLKLSSSIKQIIDIDPYSLL
jgi:primosomal protein N' (replication factor Y) (superfamily II helicase)